MPYVLTHTLFGYQALQQQGKDTEASPAFFLGCWGSDVYFANRWVPRWMRKFPADAAALLHSLSGEKLFAAFLPPTDTVELDFLKGMFCHFCLDAAAHPYITSRSHGVDHSHLEVEIDMQLYREYASLTGKPAQRQRSAPLDRLDLYMSRVTEQLTGISAPGVYHRSARLFLLAQKLSFDPKGRKRRFLRRIERLLNKKPALSGFMTSVDLEDRRDAMNRSHSPWRNPVSPESVRTDSFMELYRQGLEKARRGLTLIDQKDWQGLTEYCAHCCMEFGQLAPEYR